MSKINTKHIDQALPENMKGLAKQYYVRARKAEKELDELQFKIRTLQGEINSIRGHAYDIIGVIEGN